MKKYFSKIINFFSMREQVYAVDYEHTNLRIAEDQEDYLTLPVHKVSNDKYGRVITCFELSIWQRIHLLFSGKFFSMTLTFNKQFQPISLYLDDPVQSIYLPVDVIETILEEEKVLTKIKIGQQIVVKSIKMNITGFKDLNTIVAKDEKNTEYFVDRTKVDVGLFIDDIVKNKIV